VFARVRLKKKKPVFYLSYASETQKKRGRRGVITTQRSANGRRICRSITAYGLLERANLTGKARLRCRSVHAESVTPRTDRLMDRSFSVYASSPSPPFRRIFFFSPTCIISDIITNVMVEGAVVGYEY